VNVGIADGLQQEPAQLTPDQKCAISFSSAWRAHCGNV